MSRPGMRGQPARGLLPSHRCRVSLVALDGYATVATCVIGGEEFVVASLHPRARPATEEELAGLDPEVVRRPDVSVPWVNDVAFHLLDRVVRGRRFIVGGDLNTSRLFTGGGRTFFERATGGRPWAERPRAGGRGARPRHVTRLRRPPGPPGPPCGCPRVHGTRGGRPVRTPRRGARAAAGGGRRAGGGAAVRGLRSGAGSAAPGGRGGVATRTAAGWR